MTARAKQACQQPEARPAKVKPRSNTLKPLNNPKTPPPPPQKNNPKRPQNPKAPNSEPYFENPSRACGLRTFPFFVGKTGRMFRIAARHVFTAIPEA